jgi:hypothetical protein
LHVFEPIGLTVRKIHIPDFRSLVIELAFLNLIFLHASARKAGLIFRRVVLLFFFAELDANHATHLIGQLKLGKVTWGNLLQTQHAGMS